MVQQIPISTNVIEMLDALAPGIPLNMQVSHLVDQELRRRLARYQLTDRLFQEKYKMSLDEFEARGMVEQLDYSFEVEGDHQDWDLAVDGIQSVKHQLLTLRGMA